MPPPRPSPIKRGRTKKDALAILNAKTKRAPQRNERSLPEINKANVPARSADDPFDEMKVLQEEMVVLERTLRHHRRKVKVKRLQHQITGLESELGSLTMQLRQPQSVGTASRNVAKPFNQSLSLPAVGGAGTSAEAGNTSTTPSTSRTQLLQSEVFGKVLQKAVQILKRQAATIGATNPGDAYCVSDEALGRVLTTDHVLSLFTGVLGVQVTTV
jgi:hypothetical protein